MDQLETKPTEIEEQVFDIDLINGIRSEKKFCLEVEKKLAAFVSDPAVTQFMMPGIVDKFKRKLIHRICDRYNIQRSFVDKNSGNILLVKIPESVLPKMTLEQLYKSYCEEREKEKNHNLEIEERFERENRPKDMISVNGKVNLKGRGQLKLNNNMDELRERILKKAQSKYSANSELIKSLKSQPAEDGRGERSDNFDENQEESLDIKRVEESLYSQKNSEYEQIKQKIFNSSRANEDKSGPKENFENDEEQLAQAFNKKCTLRASSSNYDPDFDRLNGMPVLSQINYSNNKAQLHAQYQQAQFQAQQQNPGQYDSHMNNNLLFWDNQNNNANMNGPTSFLNGNTNNNSCQNRGNSNNFNGSAMGYPSNQNFMYNGGHPGFHGGNNGYGMSNNNNNFCGGGYSGGQGTGQGYQGKNNNKGMGGYGNMNHASKNNGNSFGKNSSNAWSMNNSQNTDCNQIGKNVYSPNNDSQNFNNNLNSNEGTSGQDRESGSFVQN